MSKWNKNKFSIYKSEEKTVLGLIKELGDQTNYNTDEVEKVKESNNKKVSHEEMKSKYKIDENADFTGSWFGIKRPTQSNEGIASTVEQIIDETIPNINSQLEQIKNSTTQTYYNEDISTKVKKHTNGTTYYLTTVKYNKDNPIKKSFANDVANDGVSFSDGEYPRVHAQRKNATFAINASAWYSTKQLMGVQIKDGIQYGKPVTNKWYTLGVKKDGVLKAYDGTVTPQAIIDDEVINTFCFSIPIIENGKIVSDDILNIYSEQKDLFMNRNIIGQKQNKDYVFLCCDGRTSSSKGLTIYDCIEILLKEECVFAYNLDGGGSAQTILNGALINAPTDITEGTVERKTGDILYFSNSEFDNELVQNIYKISSDVLTLERLRSAKQENKRHIFPSSVKIEGNYPTLILNEEEEGNGGITFQKNNTNIMKANFKDDGFSVYNYSLNNDLLKVDNTGEIITMKGILGEFFTSNTYNEDIDKISVNGIYWVNPNTPNIGNAGTGALLHIQQGNTNNYAIQINFRMNASTQKRVCNNGVWDQWGSL